MWIFRDSYGTGKHNQKPAAGFLRYYASLGTLHQQSEPHNPTLSETSRVIHFQSPLPSVFWGLLQARDLVLGSISRWDTIKARKLEHGHPRTQPEERRKTITHHPASMLQYSLIWSLYGPIYIPSSFKGPLHPRSSFSSSTLNASCAKADSEST